MTAVSTGNIWRFGATEFDEGAACLKTGSESVAIDRNSCAILSALLEAKGELVAKDRLLEIGWSGRVVHENSLAKAIGRLRGALGAEGANLKAVYGKGYAFEVTAERIGVSHSERKRSWPFAAPLAAAALSFVAVGVAAAVFISVPTTKENRLAIGEPANTIGRVLWVDDHPDNNIEERRALEARGVAVYSVTNTEEALMLLSMYSTYDAVISDMGRWGDSLAGFKLVKEMRARGNETPFFLYTILTSEEQRKLLADYGGQGAAETPAELYGFVVPLIEETLAVN